MKIKFYFVIFIAIMILFSCEKWKKNVLQEEIGQNIIGEPVAEMEQWAFNSFGEMAALTIEKRESIYLKEFAAEEEKEAMVELIYNNSKHVKRNRKINFIEKVNFGMPEGDNWIVRMEPDPNNDGRSEMYIFAIKDNKIEKELYDTVEGLSFMDMNPREVSEYDIMQDIPGVHIPDSVFSIGDFNGDGKYELFSCKYEAFYLGYFIDFIFYDKDQNGFTNNRFWYSLFDEKEGSSPVEFITYGGLFGLKVYRDYKWYFYTWSTRKKEYTEVVEISKEMNIDYNIHNLPLEYFENRILNIWSGTATGVENIVEIDPRIEGGRSFRAFLYYVPDKSYYEDIIDYDQEGNRVFLNSDGL
jgi:hypothetical protein